MFPFFAAVGAEQIISVMDFYTTVFSTTLLTGIIFTTPVIFVLLVRFGIVSTSIVTKNRGYIYAALFILVAKITADGGPVGDALLYLLMITLLELGV
jgi:sec-independent protein translocase protein TatC